MEKRGQIQSQVKAQVEKVNQSQPRQIQSQTQGPCFYADSWKVSTFELKGLEGVVGFESDGLRKMESVFQLVIRTLGPEAYAMNWEVLKKKMTDKYYTQGEIKKLEIELWNLKVKGNDVPAYIERFQELTLICTKFVANETEKVDKNSAPTQKGSLTPKGRLMIHPETTMVTNNNPSRGRMFPKSTIWGQAKRSLMGDLCPSAPSAIFTTMAHAPRSATNATK
ncbi:reverse transcriptase domain-containing protein [Tanacetum coccineum]